MNVILLSGGSGKRLWPLSNEVRAKQFLKIFEREDGSKESMIQRTYRLIMEVDEQANVMVATSEGQMPMIRDQIGIDCLMSVEPERRDTFPAIALAVMSMKEKCELGDNDAIVVCPVDPLADNDFYKLLSRASEEAASSDFNLILIGIEPTYPSEKYGYIIPEEVSFRSAVKVFKEKPDEDAAAEFISMGGLWNAGVFVFRVRYIKELIKKMYGLCSANALLENYSKLEKISFDYFVVEEEKNTEVFRYSGEWKDLGTWNTLTEAMSEPASGNVGMGFCENTHVVNELQIPMVVLGVRDMIVAATPDGILVSDKLSSVKLKDYAPKLRPMYEKREWGECTVLSYNEVDGSKALTKRLLLAHGKSISYQKHEKRAEQWTIVGGEGILVINDMKKKVKQGDSVYIKRGVKHAVKAVSDLHIIEVQMGEELIEEDVIRYEWDWKQ